MFFWLTQQIKIEFEIVVFIETLPAFSNFWVEMMSDFTKQNLHR